MINMLYDLVMKLIQEHRLFASDLKSIEDSINTSNINHIASLLNEFRSKLSNHIIDEESVLFPEIVNKNLVDQGFLSHIMQQHLDILEHLDKLELVLNSNDQKSFKEIIADLKIILEEHHKLEETKVFPNVDPSL
ncbi:MAG: hemerythrin domain-containing protein [Thermoprotei archaeon]